MSREARADHNCHEMAMADSVKHRKRAGISTSAATCKQLFRVASEWGEEYDGEVPGEACA